MSKVETIVANFKAIASNPKKAIADAQAKTGKPAVGVLPVYTPEEIIYAAGALPVGCWGKATKTISKARTYLPAFACSIMQSIMEMELEGVYDDLKAVVVSSPCDTLKCMGQKWKGKCPVIQFVHPQNRGLASANTFLVEEYKLVRQRLEEALGVKITDEAINEAIEVYNENRQATRKFLEVAASYPQIITPVVRHAIMKSRFFMASVTKPRIPAEPSAVVMIGSSPKAQNSSVSIISSFVLNPMTTFGFMPLSDRAQARP